MTIAALAGHSLVTGRELPAWVDTELYPFVPRSFSTPHGRMSYVDRGEGRPLVLVHGTPSWSFEWRHVIEAAADTRRVIAPDHLGFGLSDKAPTAPYTPRDHSERLLALFDALELRNVTLVLHDFGVPIGLPLALDRPDRIERLVVLNGWAWPFESHEAPARMGRFVGSALGKFLYVWLNLSPRFIVPSAFGDRKKLTSRVHRQYVLPFSARRERLAPWTLGRELAASTEYYRGLWARRDELRQRPTTLVWGDRDPAFTLGDLERWRGALPDARVVLCPGAGHFPQEEAPETVTRAILDGAP